MKAVFARWTLLASLVFVFLYFGIDKFVHPILWVGFLPLWMNGLMGIENDAWIIIIGVIEVLLALLLIIPVPIIRKIGVVLIALHLLGIIWQVGWNDVAVRDIGLMLSAVALFFLIPAKKSTL